MLLAGAGKVGAGHCRFFGNLESLISIAREVFVVVTWFWLIIFWRHRHWGPDGHFLSGTASAISWDELSYDF